MQPAMCRSTANGSMPKRSSWGSKGSWPSASIRAIARGGQQTGSRSTFRMARTVEPRGIVCKRTEDACPARHPAFGTTEGTMSEDLKKRAARDRNRINVREDNEVLYWTKELGVDQRTLTS